MKDIHCGMLIKLINDKLYKNLNKELKEVDITYSQLKFLFFMNDMYNANMPSYLKSFEQFFSVSQPTVVGIIKRLEKKGLIYLTNDEVDKRIKIAHLTDKGFEVCNICIANKYNTEKKILKNFTKQEEHQLQELLKKLYENID